MDDGKHGGRLGAVYAARSVAEIARQYDTWAASYDADMAAVGYRHPSICLALVARHVSRGAAPLLDAGAGTGMLGEWLRLIGYPEVEALDISEGMLAVAKRRGVYTRLHRAALGGPLPFAAATFAGIVSVGVFTSGHVGTDGLDELIRICRPGGAVVLTVKTTLLNESFEARLGELAAAARITRLETSEPYVSMPGEAGTVPSIALALRVEEPARGGVNPCR